jgi:hypothetical protein
MSFFEHKSYTFIRMVAKVDPKVPEMDMSLGNWIYNTRSMLHFPFTVVVVATLLIAGTFAETSSRKSLEALDSTLGRVILFIVPMFIAYAIDWPSGVLAATVALIVFAKLQKGDDDEGFMDSSDSDNSDVTTKIVSSSHRWFVEKILGESPVAISSDRIRTTAVQGETQRSSSSSSSASETSGSSPAHSSTFSFSSSSNK